MKYLYRIDMVIDAKLEDMEHLDKNYTKRVVAVDATEAIEKAMYLIPSEVSPRKYITPGGWTQQEPRKVTSIRVHSCVNISPVDLV
jgi:gamma-glutamylcyclotransferase (GGCT)/AIG2-like uncharacterized protein YtfP